MSGLSIIGEGMFYMYFVIVNQNQPYYYSGFESMLVTVLVPSSVTSIGGIFYSYVVTFFKLLF